MAVLWVFMATVFSLYKGFFSHTNPYILNVMQQCRCSPMLIFRAWATCDQTSAVERSPSITKLLSGSVSKIMCQRVHVKLEANARVYISLGSIVQWSLHSRPPLHSGNLFGGQSTRNDSCLNFSATATFLCPQGGLEVQL